ncbi:hypothetical protein [Runella sp.]|uniref:hypothetical protein n=1 Tax=Runella sp. TaxID=1960881 RepID=UPI003D0A1AB2
MANWLINFFNNRMGTANSIAVMLVGGYTFCVIYMVVTTKDKAVFDGFTQIVSNVVSALLIVKAVQTNTEK